MEPPSEYNEAKRATIDANVLSGMKSSPETVTSLIFSPSTNRDPLISTAAKRSQSWLLSLGSQLQD